MCQLLASVRNENKAKDLPNTDRDEYEPHKEFRKQTEYLDSYNLESIPPFTYRDYMEKKQHRVPLETIWAMKADIRNLYIDEEYKCHRVEEDLLRHLNILDSTHYHQNFQVTRKQ